MGSEYMGPAYEPQQQVDRSSPQNDTQAQWDKDEDTHPRPVVSPPAPAQDRYEEPAYREHVTGTLFVHPSDSPYFRSLYPTAPAPYQGGSSGQPFSSGQPIQGAAGSARQFQPVPPPGYYGQPGYYPQPGYYGQPVYPGYYGYLPPYAAPWPPAPKRDGYLFGVSIASFVCTILVFLSGIGCFFILLLFLALGSNSAIKPAQSFAGIIQLLAFSCAGLIGGGFGLYHSIRALFLQKPSADFRLPWFWLFLAIYVVVLALAGVLQAAGLSVANLALTTFLIALCGLLPALTVMALAVRRIHFPMQIRWPTTWRRVTLSLVSGATLAILLALVFELILSVLTAQALHITNIQLDNPNAPLPTNLREIGFLFLLVSVIAPVVEETVKPLAVVLLIGRVRSAAEAFILGMAGGIGFDLVETSGYMGMGYKDWLSVAIQRTSAGLLHGLGAAMVALGWYYLTHPNSLKNRRRVLIALSCWAYAILQHAIWNGSGFLQLLPGPVGSYLSKGMVTLGPISFQSFLLVYAFETVLMLFFLFFITKRLRPKLPLTTPAKQPEAQAQAKIDPTYAPVATS